MDAIFVFSQEFSFYCVLAVTSAKVFVLVPPSCILYGHTLLGFFSTFLVNWNVIPIYVYSI